MNHPFSFRSGLVSALLTSLSVLPPFSLGQSGDSPPGIPLPAGEDRIWEPIVSLYDETFLKPTEPVPLERMVLPWEPQQAVLLAFPLTDMAEDRALSRIFLDTLAAVLPHVKVIGVYHNLDRRLLGAWLDRLEKDERIAPHMDRLDLLASEVNSIWIRDFGPQFGIGRDGGLVLIDSSILDSRASIDNLLQVKTRLDPLEQHFTMVEEVSELKGSIGSDRLPAELMGYLTAKHGMNLHYARPRIFLPGGDLVLVDATTACISAATLTANGGDLAALRELMKTWYGIETLHVLDNLPGQTVEHLDFIMNPIREGIILTAEPGVELPDQRPFLGYLNRQLNLGLTRQLDFLTEEFPDHTILQVPFLPPVIATEEQIRKEVLLHIMRMVAGRIGVRFPGEGELADVPMDEMEIDERILNTLTMEASVLNWKDPEDQEKAVQFYLNKPMEQLVNQYVEREIRYRSYLNSLYLKTADGNEIVLLPSYRPQNDDEAANMTEIERRVSKIYEEACPDARQIWIECTELAGFLGVIHCFTSTIPVQP